MGLPSGRKWAIANIDLSSPSGFQEVGGVVSPYKYECSFCSWGNTEMYNPNAQNSFAGVYDWGGVNAQEPYFEGQPYGSTPGAALNADFGPSYDAARQHLGPPWRLPTSEEFQELVTNCDFIDENGNIVTAATSVAGTDADKRILMNGVVGLRLRSRINGNVIFFTASGDGKDTKWDYRGDYGRYWSSSWHSDRIARSLNFTPTSVDPRNDRYRYLGFAVRPVF